MGVEAAMASTRNGTVEGVCRALEAKYGRPRLGNPRNPVDDLVYIILSNKTMPATASKVYRELRSRFITWTDFLRVPARTIRGILRPAGLSVVKTSQLRRSLRKIRRDFGGLDLAVLRSWSTSEAEEYLLSLPGVSKKVAKCVIMYTMRGHVLPVDAHVHRIARRLGWTRKRRADQCHEELEAIVPAAARYALHVDCVVHGRLVCRPANPACSDCCIRQYCKSFKQPSNDR